MKSCIAVYRKLFLIFLALLIISGQPALAEKGDISGDGVINLYDVIAGLQCLSGLSLSHPLNLLSDVDGDQRLSMPEVFYALHIVCGLRIPPSPQVVRVGQPYMQDFSAGKPGSPQGWGYYSTYEGQISVENGRLRLDDRTSNDVYSQNEAILHLDLLGQSNVQLSGNHWNLSDETHSGDGIAISNDGVTWHIVAAFDVSSTYSFIVDLDAAVAAAGISYTSDFRIKFQQYDNDPAPTDGREWDNIRVEIVTPPVP